MTQFLQQKFNSEIAPPPVHQVEIKSLFISTPITKGHVWLIEQGAQLFDRLIVVVAHNSDKSCMFTLDERLRMLRELIAHYPHVTVAKCSDRFLVDYVASVGAKYILRGVRDAQDYMYEAHMAAINSSLNQNITTLLLIAPYSLHAIRSSTVKWMFGLKGWEDVVGNYVPLLVLEELKKRSSVT